MEHRAPLTTPRERMPPGFDIHRQIGFGTFIVVTDFALVDWHESNAVLPSGESYSIEIWWEDVEAWFRSWVAAKALGGAATALIKQEFPAIGEIPQAPYLTACETLCLFGYNRAIPGDLYFAPLKGAEGAAPNSIDALLHQAVPDPKPAESPIADAERRVMDLWRAGRLHPLHKHEGKFQELPDEVKEYAVAVNARGSVEPDFGAGQRDLHRAVNYRASITLGEVAFRTSEVRNCLALDMEAEAGQEPAAEADSATPEPEQTDKTAADVVATPNSPPRRGGGRPKKYDWDHVMKNLVEKLRDDGIPKAGDGRQAELERFAASLFQPDSCPAESMIREKVSEAIETYRKELGC